MYSIFTNLYTQNTTLVHLYPFKLFFAVLLPISLIYTLTAHPHWQRRAAAGGGAAAAGQGGPLHRLEGARLPAL